MFLIEEQLAQDVVNYLAKQPFQEVFQLIQSLSQLKTDGGGVNESPNLYSIGDDDNSAVEDE